ncbi:MAG: pre-peptidase C-terminal domain-containing protein [Bacteroidales bacterium]|nr:pre-peptidase C-terminal domain-containing protein [Bacteroidales bacterium]
MKKSITLLMCAALLFLCAASQAQTRRSGFYKDLFMDSGVGLNTYDDLPAAKFLGLEMERIATYESGDTTAATAYERMLMHNVFLGSEIDENGILLYPDGAPRFRVIYMNGGKSTTHGKFITPEGIENLRKFVENGGSYVGTCAGAFFASKGTYSRVSGEYKQNPYYAGIWPGYTVSTGLNKSATGVIVEKKSPLLKYYDFGGDMMIDSVRHNGGCFMCTDSLPAGTEVLGRFDGDTLHQLKRPIHKEVNAWAYKAGAGTGRVVVTGSHPERMVGGDRLQFFSGMIRYAMEGNGAPKVKGELYNGEARNMTRRSSANVPDYTAIGDKQYHHFTFEVPKFTKQVRIDLQPAKGYADFDLFLYAAYGEPAFNDNAKYYNVENGAGKSLYIDAPKAGTLYISVFCDTTVDVLETKYGEQYTGRVEVLNGVPYTITATIVNE